MKAVSVNFAWRRDRRLDHVGLLLLSLVLLLGAGVAWRGVEITRALDGLENERHRLSRPAARASTPTSPAEKERLRAEMRFARRVIEQLDTPWHALFAAVETAYDDNVTLLGVEPEPERREVRLTAEAKDPKAMLAYVRQVRQSPVLKAAWLASHQVNQQDPLRPVRFTIHARWAAAEDLKPEQSAEADAGASSETQEAPETSESAVETAGQQQ